MELKRRADSSRTHERDCNKKEKRTSYFDNRFHGVDYDVCNRRRMVLIIGGLICERDVSWRREIWICYEGEHTPVLEDVNFSIAEGSIVFIPVLVALEIHS